MLGRPAISVEVQRSFWAWIRRGEIIDTAAAAVGVSKTVGWRWFREAGGVMPPQWCEHSTRPARLSFAEREEIACRRAAGEGVRAIARSIGRSASTVSRELARGTRRPKTGYRATVAQALADKRARRPKTALLRRDSRLGAYVERQLLLKHSPEQISRRLLVDFPDDPRMRVSHETIYQSLYVRRREALKRELAQCLRTGRALRKPHRKPDERRSRHAGAVSISQRPAEAEDRTVPGHWEGDLITGAGNGSAIGTLVERATGFVMLLHLPNTHKALDVQEALTATMSTLPRTLRRTLTWDQGQEMANHVQITAATGLDIYFCDPHSPWQRGLNENTNGLLRQYFPKFTDLSGYHPDYLEFVAAELNNRPRKRLGWRSPAEALEQLLSEPDSNPPGVALAS